MNKHVWPKATKVCACVEKCGLVFTPHGRQRFSSACPNLKKMLNDANNRRQQRHSRVVKAAKKQGLGRICKACCNLPHARPPEGCPLCKLPAIALTEDEKRLITRVRAGAADDDKAIDREGWNGAR